MEWHTAVGDEYDIRNMEDGHLVNTIRMLRRNADAYHYVQWVDSVSLPSTTEEWLSDDNQFVLTEFNHLPSDFCEAHTDKKNKDLLALKFAFMCIEAESRGLDYTYNRLYSIHSPQMVKKFRQK